MIKISDKDLDYEELLDKNPNAYYCNNCGTYAVLQITENGDLCKKCYDKYVNGGEDA